MPLITISVAMMTINPKHADILLNNGQMLIGNVVR